MIRVNVISMVHFELFRRSKPHYKFEKGIMLTEKLLYGASRSYLRAYPWMGDSVHFEKPCMSKCVERALCNFTCVGVFLTMAEKAELDSSRWASWILTLC